MSSLNHGYSLGESGDSDESLLITSAEDEVAENLKEENPAAGNNSQKFRRIAEKVAKSSSVESAKTVPIYDVTKRTLPPAKSKAPYTTKDLDRLPVLSGYRCHETSIWRDAPLSTGMSDSAMGMSACRRFGVCEVDESDRKIVKEVLRDVIKSKNMKEFGF